MTDFRKIFRMTAQPSLLLNADDFTIEEATESYLRMMKTLEPMLVDKRLFEILPESPGAPGQMGDSLRLSLESVVNTGFSHKLSSRKYAYYDLYENFQERFWEIEHLPVFDSNGEVEYILHTVKDLTQEMQKKPDNQNAERSFGELFDGLAMPAGK